MKAFILAAGIGSRLRPITDEVPKCMVKVGDETIIERQLKSLVGAGINEIYVCTGYKHDVLEGFVREKYPFVKFVHNEDYLTTNNMYSMYLTKEFSYDTDLLVLNADVFVDPSYIELLVNSSEENAILCEKGRYIEESMKIKYDGEKITEISKKISEDETYGTTIDIYRFNKEFTKKWFDVMEDIIINRKELNLWNEVAIDEMFKYATVKPVLIGNMWFEIDNHDDLEYARKLFNK